MLNPIGITCFLLNLQSYYFCGGELLADSNINDMIINAAPKENPKATILIPYTVYNTIAIPLKNNKVIRVSILNIKDNTL